MKSNKPKIAIIPSIGLGDALVFLPLANNLQKNGFEVTYFSNYLLPFQAWLPHLQLKKTPAPENQHNALTNFDLVIAEKVSFLTQNTPAEALTELAKKYLFVFLSRNDQRLIASQPETIIAHLPGGKRQMLTPLLAANGVSIRRLPGAICAVDRIACFCRDVLGLAHVTRETGFVVPKPLVSNKYPNRVIIHPTSSNPVKNWPARKYRALAKKLIKQGLEPAFIVAPNERDAWEKINKGRFNTPSFQNLADVASFVFESGIMLGNDSGIGHLASALGVKTVSIIMSRQQDYFWRPGWAKSVLITSPSKLKIGKRYFWSVFMPVGRVFKAVMALYHAPS
jgi:heptosyltransferase III